MQSEMNLITDFSKKRNCTREGLLKICKGMVRASRLVLTIWYRRGNRMSRRLACMLGASFRSQILKGKRTWIARDVYLYPQSGSDRAAPISMHALSFDRLCSSLSTINTSSRGVLRLKVSIRRTKLTRRCRTE